MLRKTPESLNAVDVMMVPSPHQGFVVVDLQMFPELSQRVVTGKGIGVIDTPLPGLPANDPHEVRCRQCLDDFGVNLPLTLQEPQDHGFPCCASSSLALSLPPEVRIINLNLPAEFSPFQLALMVEENPDLSEDPGNCLVAQAILHGHLVRRTLFDKPQQNQEFSPQSFQGFLPFTREAFDVSSGSMTDLPFPTENALSSQPKRRQTFLVIRFNHRTKLIINWLGYEID